MALAAVLAFGPGRASLAVAAGTPGQACGQAVVKEVTKCVKKAVALHLSCYKSLGEPCAQDDEKLTAAREKTRSGVYNKCGADAAAAEAGYGPIKGFEVAKHFAQACGWQARLVVERALGADGSLYAGADEDGRKCLLNAAKAEVKHLASALKIHGKCITESCTTGDTNTAIAESATKAAASIDKKCADLNALVGLDSTQFVDAATAQIPSAVASPCDPMDTARCAFPFPNDQFTVPEATTPSGRRLALGSFSLAATADKRPVVTDRWNDADGFSIGPMIMFQNPDIDLTQTGATPITNLATSLSPTAPVILFDADTGEQQLLWVERDTRGATVADQPLLIHVGKNLKEGHRYIVALRNMRNGANSILPAPAGFALYRDNTPTSLLPVELRRPHMEDIFTTLTGFGITRGDLYLAWDFTTQSSKSTAGNLLHMRDDANDILAGAAPSFTVNTVTDPLDAGIFRQIDGTYQVPLYLNDGGVSGSTLRRDVFGTPYNTGDTFTAKFRCIVPDAATTGGAAPAIPARPSLYGHGLLGKHTEVTAGNVEAMSNEHNMIFCATDWTGFEDGDALFVLSVLGDFSFFPNFIDRQHQGILNMMTLGKLLLLPDGFASDPAFQLGGDSLIDESELFYDGNSQGGILGGVVAAFSQDIERFSLGVPGMNYSTLLNRSVDFVEFDGLLTDSYPLSTDRNLLLSVAQVLWDRTDPNGHVLHVLGDAYANTSPKKILCQVAFGDHQVAPLTVEVAARSNGMSIHTPILPPGKVVPEVTPYYGIPAIPAYPFDGSAMVIWDSGNPAPPSGNTYPPEITAMDAEWADLGPCAQGKNSDPHSCPRNNATARQQKSDFLKTGGAVTDVCGGAACLAP